MQCLLAKGRFVELVKSAGHSLSSLAVSDGVNLMLDFYSNERAVDCKIESDGDMLPYQWGCCDWGKGEFFKFDITRQFISGNGEDDDIHQLQLIFTFEPTPTLRQLGSGNRWCYSTEEVDAFRSFIQLSPSFLAVQALPRPAVELDFGVAG